MPTLREQLEKLDNAKAQLIADAVDAILKEAGITLPDHKAAKLFDFIVEEML